MNGRSTLVSLLAAAAAVIATAAGVADAAPYASLKPLGTRSMSVAGSSTGVVGGNLEIFEFPEFDVVNRKIPHSGLSSARVPAAHVPTPAGQGVASSNLGASGFVGLSHRDQRLAGTGSYVDTQFSLEPPDQALCVGNGFVLESVNTALRVFDAAGDALTPPVALNQFFGLAPEVIRAASPVYGDFTSDPKCHFDADTGRFFLTLLQADVVPETGDFTGRTHVLIAVSATGDPTGLWYTYSLDTTNDGTFGTPKHPGCPCLGDQPLIGADANGFYISTNEFPFFQAGFNGAQVYATSKAKLASGVPGPAVLIDAGQIAAPDGGIWYTLQPATTPPGGAFAATAGGTEYFMSALDFNGTLDNRIAVWALTNTSSLNDASPAIALTHVVVDSEVYGQPPDAQQRTGPLPLADALVGILGLPREKLELVAGNDDRMNQVVYAHGKLYGAVNTVVKTKNGPTRVGIAYFVVAPSVGGGGLAAAMSTQGYVAVNQQNAMYPAIGVNADGSGAMVFTLVGPDVYPSAAYIALGETGATGSVHIAGDGAAPEDGFTGYKAYGAEGRTARWGDYSAAAVAADGSVWLATEFIPGGPRTSLANWGTFVVNVTP
jgi:hypothetical protein